MFRMGLLCISWETASSIWEPQGSPELLETLLASTLRESLPAETPRGPAERPPLDVKVPPHPSPWELLYLLTLCGVVPCGFWGPIASVWNSPPRLPDTNLSKCSSKLLLLSFSLISPPASLELTILCKYASPGWGEREELHKWTQTKLLHGHSQYTYSVLPLWLPLLPFRKQNCFPNRSLEGVELLAMLSRSALRPGLRGARSSVCRRSKYAMHSSGKRQGRCLELGWLVESDSLWPHRL